MECSLVLKACPFLFITDLITCGVKCSQLSSACLLFEPGKHHLEHDLVFQIGKDSLSWQKLTFFFKRFSSCRVQSPEAYWLVEYTAEQHFSRCVYLSQIWFQIFVASCTDDLHESAVPNSVLCDTFYNVCIDIIEHFLHAYERKCTSGLHHCMLQKTQPVTVSKI